MVLWELLDPGNEFVKALDFIQAGLYDQKWINFGYDVANWCEDVARFSRNRFDRNEAKQTI
jgi:hypothetical protein